MLQRPHVTSQLPTTVLLSRTTIITYCPSSRPNQIVVAVVVVVEIYSLLPNKAQIASHDNQHKKGGWWLTAGRTSLTIASANPLAHEEHSHYEQTPGSDDCQPGNDDERISF